MLKPLTLASYLHRARAVSGPIVKPTRHSDLSLYKSWLLGIPIKFGYKAHNNFGRAVHELFLLGRRGRYKLTPDEVRHREGMIKSLWKNPVVRRLMYGCGIREKRKPAILNGVKIKFTPDAHGTKLIVDLKTTVCSSLKDFIRSCFEYGYFRQGRTYSIALGLKDYWIIGIQKVPPYRIFLVEIMNPIYRNCIKYVDQELAFLLYFYKHYGRPNFKNKIRS